MLHTYLCTYPVHCPVQKSQNETRQWNYTNIGLTWTEHRLNRFKFTLTLLKRFTVICMTLESCDPLTSVSSSLLSSPPIVTRHRTSCLWGLRDSMNVQPPVEPGHIIQGQKSNPTIQRFQISTCMSMGHMRMSQKYALHVWVIRQMSGGWGPTPVTSAVWEFRCIMVCYTITFFRWQQVFYRAYSC